MIENKKIDQLSNQITEIQVKLLHLSDELAIAKQYILKNKIQYDEKKTELIAKKPKRTIKKTQVNLTENISLDAVIVKSFDKVEKDGELYYVSDSNHFAIYINGNLFHGGVGKIFTDHKNIEKIKDCKFISSCSKENECNYYHDPTIFSNSKDIRNYVNGSWLYSPQTANKPTRGRIISNFDSIDTDIKFINNEDYSRFYDQTMHDILCSLIIMKYKNKKL